MVNVNQTQRTCNEPNPKRGKDDLRVFRRLVSKHIKMTREAGLQDWSFLKDEKERDTARQKNGIKTDELLVCEKNNGQRERGGME